MHVLSAHPYQRLLTCLLFMTSLSLGACAQKAKTLQVGATQFEAESLAAIEKIDILRQREIAAAPLAPEKASAFFVEAVKKSTKPITLKTLRQLIDPLKTDAPKSEPQWQAFLQQMRHQYTVFTATFASLDRGTLFAASDVKRTIPLLNKLIAQMAGFAQSIKDNPVEFIPDRAAIALELERVRETKPFTETTDLKLLELERQLREVAAAEGQMARDTIEQALKAAILGTELRKLLVNYDRLSVEDIVEGLSMAFKLAADIPGLDLSRLKSTTDALVAEINADQTLRTFFDTALAEINEARSESR